MKSWSKGIIPVAVTEEIKETSGSEEETDRHSFNYDIVLTSDDDLSFLKTDRITNKNYKTLHDFKGIYFVPDFYSPPDLV